MAVSERRAERKREILQATRALFDERGVRDAQIEDIARAVGINRAIIYRHFSGKEELFAETLVGYLQELDHTLADADDPTADPEARLATITSTFLDFGSSLPAFVDCAQALLRRRGEELMDEVSQRVMIDLGVAMTSCLNHAVEILEAGIATGQFKVRDPHLLANIYYTQALGVLNLATLQLSVREENPGLPTVDAVPFDEVKSLTLLSVVSMARGPRDAAD
ncbi:TetR/AcrR family transcriptional regulator [Aeromicrobium wangtongii]|uniref:TetR/AcrR family transcriptional regulator n=2 Tax=Aeromicrobium wangtongii TaxID=2969247 RepID=A0ABY5MB01_9ACTN|nr:TetR/AcrR family transcriptional regulator [Aeromicrobium wangtongii]MCD9197819.1 TetR/AcrR family transcriptional regulator [Aeromicrobium wangtongii]UUP15300.1 TetR/AcrR family transcriptional regulator [Aeromicrobium wangtongii]